MEIIWMEFKNQDQYFVAGGCAYFAETFKDYNLFETESEAWLPAGTNYCPVGNNSFELLRTKTISTIAGQTLASEISHHSYLDHRPSNLLSISYTMFYTIIKLALFLE